MIAVIFEVMPAPGRKQQYLDLAAALKAELGAIDGFISEERFQSLTNPDKMLSLSFFRDEASVMQWRNTVAHRATQRYGRSGVFADYRLRVAEVARDYGLFERDEAPLDSQVTYCPIACCQLALARRHQAEPPADLVIASLEQTVVLRPLTQGQDEGRCGSANCRQ